MTTLHLASRAPNIDHFDHLSLTLRPPRGVCKASLHQVQKPCAIGAILSQTYGNVWWWSPYVGTIIHSHGVVMELLKWHKVSSSIDYLI